SLRSMSPSSAQVCARLHLLPRPLSSLMARILRIALPIAACAALIAGCGADVPTNGVAKIGDTVITKDQFNHWLNAAAHGSAAPGSNPTVPDPPNFAKCVANQAKQPVPKGAKKPT